MFILQPVGDDRPVAQLMAAWRELSSTLCEQQQQQATKWTHTAHRRAEKDITKLGRGSSYSSSAFNPAHQCHQQCSAGVRRRSATTAINSLPIFSCSLASLIAERRLLVDGAQCTQISRLCVICVEVPMYDDGVSRRLLPTPLCCCSTADPLQVINTPYGATQTAAV